MKRTLAFSLLVLALMLPVSALSAGGSVFDDVKVVNGDEEAEVSWSVTSPQVKEVVVSRLRTGRECSFGRMKNLPVCTGGLQGDCTVEDLENGRAYTVELQAMDSQGKKVASLHLTALPGEKRGKRPEPVAFAYVRPGRDAVSVMWGVSTERDIKGYEIVRQYRGETIPTPVGRLAKLAYASLDRNVERMALSLPPVWLDQHGGPAERRYGVSVVAADGTRAEPVWTAWTAPRDPGPIRPDEVLLLVNDWDKDSGDVAEYYAKKRGVPDENILELYINPRKHPTYEWAIAGPVREYLLDTGKAATIRVIVVCYGIPLQAERNSLDSRLSDPFNRYNWGRVMGTPNPYFRKKHRFEGLYGTYLVSRLDGATPEIAMGLVDKALAAEGTVKPTDGRLVSTEGRKGYAEVAAKFKLVHDIRKRKDKTTVHSDSMWVFGYLGGAFPLRSTPWPVGSVAAWLKSDTLSNLRSYKKNKYSTWSSLLLSEGITATYGAAVEPYLQGYTRGDIFADRFLSGDYTLAEAFGMATPTLQWAMALIGDPLYRLHAVP